ncbi:hypothetical protein KDL44_04490 [bacterium]|nr:hypothetical protein [bacterium]
MNIRSILTIVLPLGLALFLCSCPQRGQDRPARGRWAGQDDSGGSASGSSNMGEASDTDPGDSAAGQAGSGGDDAQPCADAEGSEATDQSDAGGEVDNTDADSGEASDDDAAGDGSADDEAEQPCADEQADEAEESEAAPPAEPPAVQSSSVDLSGEWLALFGRSPQGVRSELWKSGTLYVISGGERELQVSESGGNALSGGTANTLKDVSLNRRGPFLIVDRGNNGRMAYLQVGKLPDPPEGKRFQGTIGGQQFSGSFRAGGNGLKLSTDSGLSFDGKLKHGAWCGFLEAGRMRGYCVLVPTGNAEITGILFVDPYMSFETGISLEIVE